ncbi:IS200/IS605 family transposase (plasmid) [Latilactobacillus sakei]
MKLDRNQHSVYLLHYHLVMVTKYRRKVIDDQISDSLKQHFERIALNYGITLEEWNHDQDHVHVLFKALPQTEIAKFLNSYKSASSRLIKQGFPEIKDNLWQSAFWSKSYCLLTTGGAPLTVIRKYIESQGEH